MTSSPDYPGFGIRSGTSQSQVSAASVSSKNGVQSESLKTGPETLKVGDIVYLATELFSEVDIGTEIVLDSATNPSSPIRLCLHAEGVADPTVCVVPLQSGARNSKVSMSLFRVERCLYDICPTSKFTKDHLARNRGEDVQYGDILQLCHLHSKGYLRFSTDPADALGSHLVYIGSRAGNNTLIQVRAEGKQGQPVYLQDSLNLVVRCEFLDYFLHVKHVRQGYRLVASTQEFSWRFYEFCELSGNKNELVTNVPITLSHKGLGLLMSYEGLKSIDWKDGFGPESHVQRGRGDMGDAEVILKNDRFDHQAYWTLEDPDEFLGGPVQAGKGYYIKHLHTGMYLSGDLTLQSNPMSLLYLQPRRGTGEKLYSGCEVQIEDDHHSRLEAGTEKFGLENLHLIPSPARKKGDKRRVDLFMNEASSSAERSVFEVQNVSKLANFITWTNEMLPVFGRFYALLTVPVNNSDSLLEIHRKTQKKELIRQVEIVRNAFQAIKDEINNSGDVMERLRKKQFLSIGLKIHVIAVDLAQTMVKRLRLETDGLMAGEMNRLFPVMMSVLNTIAKDNKWTCKELSRLDLQLCEIFPYHKKLVGSLLGEVYRMINPSHPEEHFERLCELLTTVKEENVEEQTLYLTLLRNLSEVDDTVTLASQKVLNAYFLRNEKPFFFLRLLIKDEIPYVEFVAPEGEAIEEEIIKANPALIPLLERINCAPHFSLVALTHLETYISYASQAVLLLNTLCKGDNQQVIGVLRNILGFDVRSLLTIVQDERLHSSFRGSVISLLDTIVLDRSRKVPFTTRQSNLSFRLEEVAGRVTMDEGTFARGKREEVAQVAQWCLRFWARKDQGTDLFASGTLPLLDYLHAVLTMTYTLINYHYATPSFVRAVNPAILDLLISLLSSQLEFHAERQWIQGIKNALKEGYSEGDFDLMHKVKTVQDLTIRLIKLNLDMDLRSKTEKLLKIFYHHRETFWSVEEEDEIRHEVKDVVTGAAGTVDLSEKMIFLFKQHAAEAKRQRANEAMLDILVREPHIKEFLCSAVLSDLQMAASTRQELLWLLYQILESNNVLLRMLKTVDLIEEPELLERRKFLSDFKKDFNIANNVNSVRERLISDPQETQRLATILERLLSVLSLKAMKPGLFKKTQNLARSYQVHEELLALWHILTSVETAPMLVDLVCVCLINFCYGNDRNRDELLASVDSGFFSLVSAQTPYLIQEISNFEQLPQTHAERGISYILQKCVCASPALRPGLEWVRAMISYRGQKGFKKDLQTLACFLLMERINVLHLSLTSESWDVSQIVLLLSICAHGNPVTIGHCRQVAGVSEVIEGLRNAKSPLTVKAWTAFFLEVYVNDVASEDLNDSNVTDILENVVIWVGKTVDSLRVIEMIANAGAYEQIWNEGRPYCCFLEEERVWNKEAELWRMLSCGEPWEHNSGLLLTLPQILSRFPVRSYRLQTLCQDLQRLAQEIRSGLLLLKTSNPLLNSELVLRTVQQFLNVADFNSHIKSIAPTSPEAFLNFDLKGDSSSHRKTISDASTLILTSEESTPNKTNSTRSNEAEPHFQAFVDLAAGIVGEYTQDYHVTFRDMALLTHPMKFFMKKHLAGSKRTELVKMLKLLNTKISPTLKFMIFDLLDAVLHEVPDKPAISKVFIDSGLVEAAVSAIVEQPNFKLMKSAVAFLNGLFEKQSAEFLIWFLEKLKASGAYLRLFAQLKAELGCSLDRIIMRGSDPNMEKHLTAYERDIFSGLLQSGSPLSDVFELANDYSINLVRFMQLCCDNCNLPFQEFMNTQTTSGAVQRGSVNVVETIANYVIVMSQYEALFSEDSEAKSTLIVSLEALLDFVTGPCTLNQNKLGTDIQFLLALNRILKVCAAHKDDLDWVVMYGKTLDFLMTLFEGSPSEAVLNSLIQYLDIAFLLSDMKNIYTEYIQGKEQDLLLESPNAPEIAKVGFKIAILASFSQYYFRRHPELASFSITNIKKKPSSSFDLMKFWVTKGLPDDCVGFFYAFIGYVEIARNGRIESHYFQIPFACKFLTEETKESIIIDANRSSQQEKVDSFLDMVNAADVEMRHQQYLYRIPGIKYLSEGWQLCGWAAFILVIVINLTILADTEESLIADGDPWIRDVVDKITVVINIVQIVMMTLSYIFFLIEYYPNIVAGEMVKHASLEFPQYSSIRHNDSLLMAALTNSPKTPIQFEQATTRRKLFLLAKNMQNLSFCAYLIVSILSFWWRFLYCFLLLDIFKRSPELGNILRAITLNRRQLILTTVFWILLVYIFSGIGLYQFSSYYSNVSSMYCSTLWECFISSLHMGVRFGGGIGEALNLVQIEDPRYYPRVLFDLLFFAIINLIIQNIIFGIIVDTFGELRDKRNAMLEDINQKCYICGSSRSQIERSGTGWSHHFLNEHSPFAYLAFIKYVQAKEMNECNGLEKFVKEKLIEKDSCFFPTSSRVIMASEMSETAEHRKRFRFRAR